MKIEITWFVEKCLTCRKLKDEHQRSHDKIQPLPIPMWMWEDIAMDFIIKLPMMTFGVDFIWVIVDRFTKSTHFILIAESISTKKLTDVYVGDMVVRHGVLVLVVSD